MSPCKERDATSHHPYLNTVVLITAWAKKANASAKTGKGEVRGDGVREAKGLAAACVNF